MGCFDDEVGCDATVVSEIVNALGDVAGCSFIDPSGTFDCATGVCDDGGVVASDCGETSSKRRGMDSFDVVAVGLSELVSCVDKSIDSMRWFSCPVNCEVRSGACERIGTLSDERSGRPVGVPPPDGGFGGNFVLAASEADGVGRDVLFIVCPATRAPTFAVPFPTAYAPSATPHPRFRPASIPKRRSTMFGPSIKAAEKAINAIK